MQGEPSQEDQCVGCDATAFTDQEHYGKKLSVRASVVWLECCRGLSRLSSLNGGVSIALRTHGPTLQVSCPTRKGCYISILNIIQGEVDPTQVYALRLVNWCIKLSYPGAQKSSKD